MALATFLGFPRMGAQRELKRALEQFWSGQCDAASLDTVACKLRQTHWQWAEDAGIDHIPSNDFSYYDHVLDMACTVGAVPEVYTKLGLSELQTYFAMARGHQDAQAGIDAPALEMTKWFDTNYHYIVPQLAPKQIFALQRNRPLEAFTEARKLGIDTRPVLLGPVSFLRLAKSSAPGAKVMALLPALLPVYTKLLQSLGKAGATWVQIDEPCLVQDLDSEARQAYETAYRTLATAVPGVKLLLTTYFGALQQNAATALRLPVAGIHLDAIFGHADLDPVLQAFPKDKILSLGVVNGRNIWRTDLDAALKILQKAEAAVGPERLWVASSCSLLHSPIDLDLERNLPQDVRPWLAFAKQKFHEIVTLSRALGPQAATAAEALAQSRAACAARQSSVKTRNPAVAERMAAIAPAMAKRSAPHKVRSAEQQRALGLPFFPTTTIGSFPQTSQIRAARAEHRAGKRSGVDYQSFLQKETQKAIRMQEELGLDVLVHGEFERNDMVGYFGEHMQGYVFSDNGWVQSYGSRCVKPPIIYGDVSRPEAMTVGWITYAQSLTDRPVKGMLTGPVTMLQWSFVRDDQPREVTCRQLALALRDEVTDLEAAGIRVIQIDEPALREGLPLRRAEWNAYLGWATECFRLSAAGVRNTTQIHTHMCYSEFGDIIEAIAALDADVISIEASRSRMELLEVFARYQYPQEIGLGVYDIHSPRVPAAAEMEAILHSACRVLRPQQLWVNPDCGLKTRRWEEVRPALTHMVQAARALRTAAAARQPRTGEAAAHHA